MNRQDEPEETTYDSETEQHIANLSHPDKRVRREAEAHLRHEGAAAYPALLAQLEKEQNFAASGERLMDSASQPLLNVSLLICTLGLVVIITLLRVEWGLWIWAIGLPLLFFSLFLGSMDETVWVRRGGAYRFLQSVKDLRLIEALIARYSPKQLWENPEALALLEKLLPRMTPEYWRSLPSPEQETIISLIQQQSVTDRTESQRFAMKGLRILETVGASEASPTIAHIAKYGMSKGVRDAALQWQSRMNMPQTEG